VFAQRAENFVSLEYCFLPLPKREYFHFVAGHELLYSFQE